MLTCLPTAPSRHTHAFTHVTQPQLPVSPTRPSLFLQLSLYSPRTETAHYAIISIKAHAGLLNRIRTICSLSSACTQPRDTIPTCTSQEPSSTEHTFSSFPPPLSLPSKPPCPSRYSLSLLFSPLWWVPLKMQQLWPNSHYYANTCKAGPWSSPQALGPQAQWGLLSSASEEDPEVLPKTNRKDVGCIIFPPLFQGRFPVLIKKDHHGLHRISALNSTF